MFHFTILFSILHSPDAGKSIACLRARHRPTVTIRLPSSVTFAFQLGWRWIRIHSQYSPPHRPSLATDYRESNFTLDTWEKVRSKGLSVHWRGSKYSTLVALIRNATAGSDIGGQEAVTRRQYWQRLATGDTTLQLARDRDRAPHSSPFSGHHWCFMPFQISTYLQGSNQCKSKSSKSIIPIA